MKMSALNKNELLLVTIAIATFANLRCQVTELNSRSCYSNTGAGPTNGEIMDTLRRIERKLGCGSVATNCDDPTEIQDCEDLKDRGVSESGAYQVCYLGRVIRVYCDFDSPDNGPYLVFQRRADGSTNFFRSYSAYVDGFGEVENDFWMGLSYLHRYTTNRQYSLRVDLEDFESNTRFAVYREFGINSSSTNYTLRASNYSGNAGDAMRYQNNRPFTTFDQTNANNNSCAKSFPGGWWFTECFHCHLNGLYLGGANDQFAKGVIWFQWRRNEYSLKRAEMKMKRL